LCDETDTSIDLTYWFVADHTSPGIFLFGKNKPFYTGPVDAFGSSCLVWQCRILAGKQGKNQRGLSFKLYGSVE
jgi:hypothetical protein